jgi:hypothetical protein
MVGKPGSSCTKPVTPLVPPGGFSNGPESEDPQTDSEGDVDELLHLAREGGVEFLNHLLAKAIPPDSETPDTANVREWTFRDIIKMPKVAQQEWKQACCEELDSLRRCKVFKLVDPPKGRKVIKNRWVFDLKSDGRKKARLVAKGFFQVEGIDYDTIFSLVVWFETVRLMIALAALQNWHITGLDIKTAFLYGELDEELYMEQPEGFKVKGQEGKVLHLKRAIYGLKQATLAWWKVLDKSMGELGFMLLPRQVAKLSRCGCDPFWFCSPHDACFIHKSCLCEGSSKWPPVKLVCSAWVSESRSWLAALLNCRSCPSPPS